MELLEDKNYLLIIFGVLAIVLELVLGVVTGFDLLLLGIILIISGSLGILSGSFTFSLASIAFLSLLYVFGGRRFIKNKLHIGTKSTNIDSVIGEKGIVIKSITPDSAGQIKVHGEIWRAESTDKLVEGQTAIVKSVSGVTLQVSLAS